MRALGHDVTLAPLLATEAIGWHLPPQPPAALMLTSAAAVRLAGPLPAAWRTLPLFVVGDATAAAAQAAGFGDVRDGGGTVQALLGRVAAAGFAAVLHLAGEDRTPVTLPAGLHVETRIVYRARLQPMVAAADPDWVLLYSARTARHFAAEWDRLGRDRAGPALAAIGPAVAAAAGAGWRALAIAATPDESALLSVAGLTSPPSLCQ